MDHTRTPAETGKDTRSLYHTRFDNSEVEYDRTLEKTRVKKEKECIEEETCKVPKNEDKPKETKSCPPGPTPMDGNTAARTSESAREYASEGKVTYYRAGSGINHLSNFDRTTPLVRTVE